MPTIITHAIVPLSAALAIGRPRLPTSVALAGAALAMLPDADVIGFRFGVAYDADWGHRGATHSLAIAALATIALVALWPRARSPLVAGFLFLSAASHGLLDMLTNGGLGVALFWPVDATRHFWPWQPIEVSPIGGGFFSLRGVETLLSEFVLVWLPCAALIVVVWTLRRNRPAAVS